MDTRGDGRWYLLWLYWGPGLRAVARAVHIEVIGVMRAVLLSPGLRAWPVALAVAVLLVVASCGGASNSGSNESNNSGAQLRGTLTVLAAASLNDAFDEIGQQCHKMHPGVEVKFSYAGSSSLVTQIKQGITADIFASADATNMSAVTSAGLASGQQRTLAHNLLEIVTERGNPKNIRTIQNLTNPGLKVVLCAPAVPCGRYAACDATCGGRCEATRWGRCW